MRRAEPRVRPRGMGYEDALAALYRLESRGIRLGVERMARALRHRGHPQRGQRYIHVAGTNGKGSVAVMLESCLRAAGYRTGLFTSPHMHRWVERIRIDGKPLSTSEAAWRIEEALAVFAAPGAPEVTFFELSNLIAVEAFRDHGCDVAIMEVGLGGRLDSTNALPSLLTCITRVALDHTSVLGEDTARIAREKAGILRAGAPLVSGVRDPAARRVILARARRLGLRQVWLDGDLRVRAGSVAGSFAVQGAGRRIGGLKLRLAGGYQRDNAALAVAALWELSANGLRVPSAAIRRGLATARWAGRLELLAGKPRVLLDAAHNPDGCDALVQHLAGLPRRAGRRVLVFAAMADKPHADMLARLGPCFDRVIFAPIRMSRAADPSQLQESWPGASARSVPDALWRARRSAGADGLVVVAGSIFLVAQARARLLGLRSDPHIRM